MMKARLQNFVVRLKEERGEINIISFAISLPVLVLVGTAAMDIVRYPITKQQIGSAAETGIDYLVLEQNENSTVVDTAAGRDWCAILSDNHPRRSCPNCDKSSGICTGSADAAGEHAVKMAVNQAYKELTKSGLGVMTHAGKDVNVVGGIYNLIASSDPASDNLIVGVEQVAELDASEWGGTLDYSFSISNMLTAKFVTPGNVTVAPYLTYMPDAKHSATHASVAVFAIAVRINNIFKLPDDMQFGAPRADGVVDGNETIIVSTIIRPLQRGIRLSGELAAIPN